jgi:hypothetical protein
MFRRSLSLDISYTNHTASDIFPSFVSLFLPYRPGVILSTIAACGSICTGRHCAIYRVFTQTPLMVREGSCWLNNRTLQICMCDHFLSVANIRKVCWHVTSLGSYRYASVLLVPSHQNNCHLDMQNDTVYNIRISAAAHSSNKAVSIKQILFCFIA